MQGFGRWRAWLERAFPHGADFAALLAEQARLTAASVAVVSEQIRDGALDVAATDTCYAAVTTAARSNLDALNRAFSTPFDREDLFRAIGELSWIAEYADHAAREMAALGVSTEPALVELAQILEAGTRTLAGAYQALATDRTLAGSLADKAATTDASIRRRYESALADLLVDGADPIDAMRRREIYHHLTDGGKRVRKAARVLSSMVIKDPS